MENRGHGWGRRLAEDHVGTTPFVGSRAIGKPRATISLCSSTGSWAVHWFALPLARVSRVRDGPDLSDGGPL